MTAQLFVLLGDHAVGRLTRDDAGSLTVEYDEAWLEDESAYPLSISMPLARTRHSGDVVEAYLWGLLPDSEIILDGWRPRSRSVRVLAHVCSAPSGSSAHADGFVHSMIKKSRTVLTALATVRRIACAAPIPRCASPAGS